MPTKPADKAGPKRRRASARFSPSEEFEAALEAAAQRQVGEALSRRCGQMKIDDLVLRAILAANAIDHDLPTADFAKVVTAMLGELVAGGAVAGKLPSDARLESIIVRYLKTGLVKETSDRDPI